MAEPKETQIEEVEIECPIKSGVMIINGNAYQITKGKVKVAATDAEAAKRHIEMGG